MIFPKLSSLLWNLRDRTSWYFHGLKGQGHRSSYNCLFISLVDTIECTKVCSVFLAVCSTTCAEQMTGRDADRQHWPAVVSTSRAVGMKEIFPLSLLKPRASSFRMASSVSVSALQRKSSDFSGIRGGESFWQGVKESRSSSLSLSDLTLMDCFVVQEQGKRC